MWGRACSRWRRYIRHQCKLTHRHREQARSHRGLAVSMEGVSTRDQGGSEPAREGVGPSNIDAS
ncbi:hypothetical protein FGE05_25330 [Pseudomonas sp. ICMP22404]|nr:hypothetical protein FGE05_25330 [Pseudomonas sp. ICMP22404]